VPIEEDAKEELVVICPICNGNVKYTSSTNPDEVLSIHIDQCQKSQPSRRTTRSRTKSNYNSSITAKESSKSNSKRQRSSDIKDSSSFFDDDFDQDISAEEEHPAPRICEARNMKRKTVTDLSEKVLSSASTPSYKKFTASNVENVSNSTRAVSSSCKDDLELWEYEDRVNIWIENGVSNMVSLPEQQPSSELPGKVVFPGGLAIPAWINNRLFPYQRSALRWLWELYKQKSGSILGDEMGLVRIS
jgi:DNA excision repair protein ERCC-6